MPAKTEESGFFDDLYDELPDAIIWLTPAFEGDELSDFRIGYMNQSCQKFTPVPVKDALGQYILRDGMPIPEVAAEIFLLTKEVYLTGVTSETQYYSRRAEAWVDAIRKKYKGGVLVITRDQRKLRDTQERHEKTERSLTSLVDNAPIGIVLYEAVRDSEGTITDFVIRVHNERSNELTGISGRLREAYTFRQLLNHLGLNHVFAEYVRVVEEGVSINREQFVSKSGKWVAVSSIKFDDGVMVMVTDITEVKLSQQALKEQSEFNKSILDASYSGIVALEAIAGPEGSISDYRVLSTNKRIGQFVTMPPEQLVGEKLSVVFPYLRNSSLFKSFEDVLTNEQGYVESLYNSPATGKWYQYVIVKLRKYQLVLTIKDITSERLAELQIEEQRSLLEHILQHSPSGIIVHEAIRNESGVVEDFSTISSNQAAETFTGIPTQERLSKSVLTISPELRDSPLFIQALQALEHGNTFRTEYFDKVNQSWLEMSIAKMNDNRLLNMFADITERKKSEAELKRYLEELTIANKNLEEFASIASHDLKEPVRKIRYFSEKLYANLGDRLHANERDYFQRLDRATNRMSVLIDDLLAYSQSGIKPETFSGVNLRAIVEEVVKDFDFEVELSKASFKIDIDELDKVLGDLSQLRQVFQNVIGNAIKYSRNRERPEIEVSCLRVPSSQLPPAFNTQTPDEYYIISVKDNGVGFDQEYADKIFNVFTRLHGNSEYAGSGVGLAIVKKVMDNHRGFVTAESRENEGATFNLYLPAFLY